MSGKVEELRSAVEELRVLQNQAQHPRVKDLLSIDLRKLETDLSILVAKESEVAPRVPTTSSGPKVYTVKLTNYAWDQSDKFVKIFVTLKDVQSVPAENVNCTFGPRSMELLVRHLEGKNHHLPITNLLLDISPEASHWKIKRDTVVIFMAKVNQGQEWSHVTVADKRAADARAPKSSGGGADEDLSDPSSGLMSMMKKMYQDGDDDMKRTIAKAWTESQNKSAEM